MPVESSPLVSKEDRRLSATDTVVSLVVEDLCVVSTDGVRILDSISGSFGPSDFTAVMGPSGSGKTTLLDVLSGARDDRSTLTTTGSVTANGVPLDNSVVEACVRRVPQDDLLFPMLTTMEILVTRACLAGYPPPQAVGVAEELLTRFDMESAQDVRVGDKRAAAHESGLSGGQKRRLSVMMELVSRPAVLILDEPTSGLDVMSATTLCGQLAALAQGGTTVVCSIHQPSADIFFTFQKLLLLKAGTSVYHGPVTREAVDPYGGPTEPIATFKSCGFECPLFHNPADYVLEVVTLASPAEAAAIFAACAKRNPPVKTANAMYMVLPTHQAPPFSLQLQTLLRRHFTANLRDRAILGARLIAPICIALLTGGLFFDLPDSASPLTDCATFAFMPLVYFTMSPHASTLGVMLPELATVKKEVNNSHYSISAYYLAKCLIEFPLLLIGPLVYIAIAGTMSGLLLEGWRFFAFYGVLAVQVLTTYAWTITVCCTVRKPEVATIIGPALIGPFALFCGFLRPVYLEPWPLRWISYIDYMRYTYEMAMFSLFKERDMSSWAGTDGITWDEFLTDDLGISETGWKLYGMNMGITWVFILAFIALGYWALRKRTASAAVLLSDPAAAPSAAAPTPTTTTLTPTEASVMSSDEKVVKVA